MDDKIDRIWPICLTVVALGILGFLTSCGFQYSAREQTYIAAWTTRITVCAESGGEWLRTPNVEAYECRRP